MPSDIRTTRLAINPPPRKADGVYTLQDFKDRCVIDDLTQCWRWGLSAPIVKGKATPRVHTPPGVIEGTLHRVTYTAPRYAVLLSGHALRSDQVVWRTCLDDLCCNPKHLKFGTRIEEGIWRRNNGHLRGDPRRKLANRRSVITQALPVAVVRNVEQMLESGVPRDVIAKQANICKQTICKISQGHHLHQRQKTTGFSVFTTL